VATKTSKPLSWPAEGGLVLSSWLLVRRKSFNYEPRTVNYELTGGREGKPVGSMPQSQEIDQIDSDKIPGRDISLIVLTLEDYSSREEVFSVTIFNPALP